MRGESTPPEIHRRRDAFRRLQEAKSKLLPVVEQIVELKSQYLTSRQYQDSKKASKLLKSIVRELPDLQAARYLQNITFDAGDDVVDDGAPIYVDTRLLLQLVDLRDVLEEIETRLDGDDDVDESNNKVIVKVLTPPTSGDCWTNPEEFVLMPSLTEVLGTTTEESKTSKSTEEVVQVTDVGGAKEIIAKCIRDLERVNVYLSKRRADVATGLSETYLEDFASTVASPVATPARGSVRSEGGGGVNVARERCCCSDPCLQDDSQEDLDGCDEDKVVICIKGRTEDEGDIRVVVRQCPECRQKHVETRSDDDGNNDPQKAPPSPALRHGDEDDVHPTALPSDYRSDDDVRPTPLPSAYRSDDDDDVRPTPLPSAYRSDDDDVRPTPLPSAYRSDNDDEDVRPTPGQPEIRRNDEEVRSTPRHSDIRHHDNDVEKKRSADPGHEGDEEPSRSLRDFIDLISNGYRRDSSDKSQNSEPASAVVEDPQVYSASCSKIRMYDTARLCLETEKGDELLISLTVTPTNKASTSPDRILDDLFGDDDRVIPVMRTKICSSLDFDVTAADTKIRRRPIRHQNASIVVRLNDLGADKLLRACRPAKCCRKAVLGEKTRKSLPYPASIASLPLDDDDVGVIGQSLQMSLQKVKNSTDLQRDVYRLAPKTAVQTIMYCFVRLDGAARVKRAFSYYVNLVRDGDDVRAPPPPPPICCYDVMYFAVHHSTGRFAGDGGDPGRPLPETRPRRRRAPPPPSRIPVYRGKRGPDGKKVGGSPLARFTPQSDFAKALSPPTATCRSFNRRTTSKISLVTEFETLTAVDDFRVRIPMERFARILYDLIANEWIKSGTHLCNKTAAENAKKKRQKQNLTGLSETENVVLLFESETSSVVSSISNAQIFPNRSCAIGSSLVGLKQISERSEKDYKMGPLKYLVYNNDTRSSILQKIVDKTRETFARADPSNDEAAVCAKCRCYLSNCPIPGEFGASCACPEDNKNFAEPSTTSDVRLGPRKTEPTKKSFRHDVRSRLKKSLSSIVQKRNVGEEARLCGCSKHTKNAETMCAPPNLKLVPCQVRLTQTCECERCDSFAEDGSCYCSHCLGSLDKGLVAKPASVDAAVSYDESDKQNFRPDPQILYSFVSSPPDMFR